MRTLRRTAAIRVLWLAVVVCLSATPTAPQGSSNFEMVRVTISPAAGVATSSSFDTRVSFGEEGPVGAASFCNAGFAHAVGFWSITGSVPVPIRLVASRDPVDPSRIELSWTGAFPSFEIFRSDLASDVLDPIHLTLTTTECTATDVPPGGPDIHFYLVRGVDEGS